MTENRRRALAGAYFDAGMTEKAEGLFRSWLDADPGWGWGWTGWADCCRPGGGKPKDLGRTEDLLRRGYSIPGVRDRAYIVERLQHVCEDTGRPSAAREFGGQARRLRRPARSPAGPAVPPGGPGRAAQAGRNSPCPYPDRDGYPPHHGRSVAVQRELAQPRRSGNSFLR
jgi:hypothetical protein